MPPQNVNSQSSAPLPLFRPEPIAARLRMEGEVILIRPLSITLLSGLALLLAFAGTAALLLIRVPETRSTPVAISTAGDSKVSFTVPQRLGSGLAIGDHLSLSVPSATGEHKTDITILDLRLSPAAAADSASSTALVIAAVPVSEQPLSGVTGSAEVPAGSRSLLNWLLHREGE